MKSLTQYIKADGSSLIPLEEKLRIGKDWKPEATVGDFNDITEIIAVAFDNGDKDWFIDRYEISRIDRHDENGESIYKITARSKHHGTWNEIKAVYIPEEKVLFIPNSGYKYVVVHPNDIDKLKLLYDTLFGGKGNIVLEKGAFASINYLTCTCLGINYDIMNRYFVYRTIFSNMACTMGNTEITDLKKDLEKMIK